MKTFQTFGNIVFILIFSISVIAQSKEKHLSPTGKIAVVDTSIFKDKNQGIKILIEAEANFKSDDNFYLPGLIERVDNLQKEIDELIAQNKSAKEKYVELQKLKSELKQARENDENYRHKRYSLMITPINKKIREKMREFIQQKGYALVLDKLDESAIFEGEPIDVTLEFIQFCNESFEKERRNKVLKIWHENQF